MSLGPDPTTLDDDWLRLAIRSADATRAHLFERANQWRDYHSQLAHEYERRMGETHDEAQWWDDFNDSPL